ncbi:uncharacterized protein LOC134253101 [Saccostrea cucullata]|uniref:uncharacterized protein LOC134253101 n=1 Tax=Saccostrea cuccullata TaxID=36930 RepID=UPI002ED69596
MNCESYGNCDGEPVVYHCAINPWRNATVEVCAPETFMTAHYCPHFNTGVGRVLKHHKYPCEECPFNYKSTKGYKYETCKNITKNKISNVKSYLTTATRNKLPFKKSDLSIRTAFSEAIVRNAEESLNSRSGSIEIIIAVSGLGCLALLILVIVAAVLYKKGKLLTKEAYPKKRTGKESSKEDSCPEKENCLQNNAEHDKRTIPDNSELLGIS